MKEWIKEKCKWLANEKSKNIDKFVMTAMYYGLNDYLKINDRERLSLAYAISKCWVEYGFYDFDLIEKWAIETYENSCSM